MNRVLRFVLAALLACSALVLSACQNSPSGSNDKKTYKIGVLRIDDSLPLYTAESEKLFAKHGVDVQVIEFSSAADQQKAMEAGELDGMMTDMIVTGLMKKPVPTSASSPWPSVPFPKKAGSSSYRRRTAALRRRSSWPEPPWLSRKIP